MSPDRIDHRKLEALKQETDREIPLGLHRDPLWEI